VADRVNRANDRPVYRQIADLLRAEIGRGDRAPGSQLPSETALIARYGVSRVTVRRALAVLVNDGLVLVAQGRGYFVRTRPRVRRLSADRFVRRHDDAAGTEVGHPDLSIDVLFVGRACVPAGVAEKLGVSAGDEVIVRHHRYFADGKPVEAAMSYFPVDVAAGTPIAEPNPGPGGVYARIENQGLTFEKFDEEITARIATEEESRLLQLPGSSPVLHVLRTAIAGGRPVEVRATVMDAAAFVFAYSLPARSSPSAQVCPHRYPGEANEPRLAY
jgi:GntR family transcriptional regulator